jgi:hypothetical protein
MYKSDNNDSSEGDLEIITNNSHDFEIDFNNPHLPEGLRDLLRLAIDLDVPGNLTKKYENSRQTNWERDWEVVCRYYFTDTTYEQIATNFPEYNFNNPASVISSIRRSILKIYREVKSLLGSENLPLSCRDRNDLIYDKVNLRRDALNELQKKIDIIKKSIENLENPDNILSKLGVTREVYSELRKLDYKVSKSLPRIYSQGEWVIRNLKAEKNLVEIFNHITDNNLANFYDTMKPTGLITSLTEAAKAANLNLSTKITWHEELVEFLRKENLPVAYIHREIQGETRNYRFIPTSSFQEIVAALKSDKYKKWKLAKLMKEG